MRVSEFGRSAFGRPRVPGLARSPVVALERHIGLAITTSSTAGSLPIESESWLLGELPKPSAIKPWNPTILKHDEVRSVAGVLRAAVVDTAVSELTAIGSAPEPG